MKKYYQELHLKKLDEISPEFVLSKVYLELHLAFVEIAPDGNCPFGISFPEYDLLHSTLGRTIQIFSDSREMFDLLALSQRLRRYRDYLVVGDVKEAPTPRAYASFFRFHQDSPAKVRRFAKRHHLSLEEAGEVYTYTKVDTFPTILLDSKSTGMKFPICIQMKEHAHPVEGCYGSYGLSKTTTVPVW